MGTTPGAMEWQRSGEFARGLAAHGVRSVVVGDLTQEWYLYALSHDVDTIDEGEDEVAQAVDEAIDAADTESLEAGLSGTAEADIAAEEAADEAEESEEEPEEQVQVKKAKPKRGAPGLESSVFHGKSMHDYQGRTYMHPPLSEAPQLQHEAGAQECFIPKVCIHTWTGHTQGVSVLRLLPNTGHLLLSGSMDTKIKVSWTTANISRRH